MVKHPSTTLVTTMFFTTSMYARAFADAFPAAISNSRICSPISSGAYSNVTSGIYGTSLAVHGVSVQEYLAFAQTDGRGYDEFPVCARHALDVELHRNPRIGRGVHDLRFAEGLGRDLRRRRYGHLQVLLPADPAVGGLGLKTYEQISDLIRSNDEARILGRELHPLAGRVHVAPVERDRGLPLADERREGEVSVDAFLRDGQRKAYGLSQFTNRSDGRQG